MKILCHYCGEKAYIRSSCKKTEFYKELYCQCYNKDCLAYFVYALHYKHSLYSPQLKSKTTSDQSSVIKDIVKNFSVKQKKELVEALIGCS